MHGRNNLGFWVTPPPMLSVSNGARDRPDPVECPLVFRSQRPGSPSRARLSPCGDGPGGAASRRCGAGGSAASPGSPAAARASPGRGDPTLRRTCWAAPARPPGNAQDHRVFRSRLPASPTPVSPGSRGRAGVEPGPHREAQSRPAPAHSPASAAAGRGAADPGGTRGRAGGGGRVPCAGLRRRRRRFPPETEEAGEESRKARRRRGAAGGAGSARGAGALRGRRGRCPVVPGARTSASAGGRPSAPRPAAWVRRDARGSGARAGGGVRGRGRGGRGGPAGGGEGIPRGPRPASATSQGARDDPGRALGGRARPGPLTRGSGPSPHPPPRRRGRSLVRSRARLREDCSGRVGHGGQGFPPRLWAPRWGQKGRGCGRFTRPRSVLRTGRAAGGGTWSGGAGREDAPLSSPRLRRPAARDPGGTGGGDVREQRSMEHTRPAGPPGPGSGSARLSASSLPAREPREGSGKEAAAAGRPGRRDTGVRSPAARPTARNRETVWGGSGGRVCLFPRTPRAPRSWEPWAGAARSRRDRGLGQCPTVRLGSGSGKGAQTFHPRPGLAVPRPCGSCGLQRGRARVPPPGGFCGRWRNIPDAALVLSGFCGVRARPCCYLHLMKSKSDTKFEPGSRTPGFTLHHLCTL